jgi:hypothetical protein
MECGKELYPSLTTFFGDTLRIEFRFYPDSGFLPDDVMFFVIRNQQGRSVIHKSLPIQSDTDGWVSVVEVEHSESEKKLRVGEYSFGLSYYRNPTMSDGVPTDGHPVVQVIPFGKIFVADAVAREEGT